MTPAHRHCVSSEDDHQEEYGFFLVFQFHLMSNFVLLFAGHINHGLVTAVGNFIKCSSSHRLVQDLFQSLVLEGRWEPVNSRSCSLSPQLFDPEKTQWILDLSLPSIIMGPRVSTPGGWTVVLR